jgi:Arm DNA-binding domain
MLTAIQVRHAKPKEKPYKLVDGKGLFLHIATSGKKTRRYGFELSGKESTFVIGEYPVMSPETARIERTANPDFSSVQAVSGSKFLAMNYSNLCSLPKY